MGKVSLIVVMVFIGVIGVITLSVYNSSSQVADVLAAKEATGNAENLGTYALKYAIKEVKTGNVTSSTIQNFDNFAVLNGNINSLIYNFNEAADTVRIKANVSWQGAPGLVEHQSEAWVQLRTSGSGSGGSGGSAAPFELEDEKTDLYTVPNRFSFWKFNENGGNTAHDSVSDNDGELTDGYYWNGYSLPQWEVGRSGKEGSALKFNGWDNYVHVSDADSLDLTDKGTISTWVYIEDYTNSNSAGFVHKGDLGELHNWQDEAYSLQTDGSGEYAVFIINNDENDLWLWGNKRLQKKEWHHLIATFNSEKVALYIDGELDEEIENTIGEVRNTSGGLNIGAQTNQYDAAYGHLGLDGMIDQVSIFREYLNADKAKKLYLQELAATYLALDEPSGDIAHDYSGADNHAQLSDGLEQNWTTGSTGNGLLFNADTDRLKMPSAPNLTDMDEISIAAWINIDEFTGSDADIVNKDFQYTLRLGSATDSYRPAGIAYLNGNDENVSTNYNDRISVSNRWYHLAFTYDDEYLKIYIDADEKASNKKKNKDIEERDNTIYIGGSQSSHEFKGILDELMIFEKGLTPDQVEILHKRDVVKELRGRWTLNEGGGEIAYDTSKYSHDGDLQTNGENLPEWVTGKYAKALHFDGDDFVGAEQGLVSGYPFSMGAWVRTGSMANENNDRVIFSIANNQKSNSYWGIYLGRKNHGEGRAVIGACNGSLEADYSSETSARIDDGTWHFVVGVFAAADSRKIYVDGQLQAMGSHNVEFDANINSWAIGRWCDSSPSSYFQGDIDHVRIWNRALTASEVIYLNTDPNYSTDLRGYWDMNEDSGTQVLDNSQYGNTGQLTNSSGDNSWVSGQSGNALKLDGVDDYVLIPDDSSLDGVNKMSIEFWVYPTNLDWSSRGIISKREGNDNQAYSLYFNTFWWINKLYIAIDSNNDRFSAAMNFENNRWYYVVVTYDGVASESERVKVYIDGELDTTAYESSSSIPNYNSNLYLGVLDDDYNSTLGGKLDEVKIHNRVLTSTEVQNNFSGGSDINLDNLVSYWNLDEGAGTIANDIQDGNTGTIENNATWIDDGILGSALQLDGNNDYISVDNSQNLQISEQLTLEMWVNTSQKNKTTVLAEKVDCYGLGQDSSMGWYSYIYTGGYYYNYLYWNNGKPQHHRWYYLVLTYDGTEMKFYVDGQLHDSTILNNNISTYDSDFNIGYDSWYQTYFKGKVDEIRVWNIALTKADIESLYNEGSPIVPEPGGGGETVFKIVYWSE